MENAPPSIEQKNDRVEGDDNKNERIHEKINQNAPNSGERFDNDCDFLYPF
jgi:hypothetical protein